MLLTLLLGPLAVLAALGCPSRAAAEDSPMDTHTQLTLQVKEIIQYSADLEAAVAFYRDQLGWGIIWQSPGGLAVIDAGGAYQLVLVAARWAEGWQEGQAVPPPQLSLQSQDLAADLALLAERGLPPVELEGDPEQMLSASIPFADGLELFAWQDTVENSASKVVEDYHAANSKSPLYSLGECVFFVEDIGAAMTFLIEKLGFAVRQQHGEVYTALRIAEGPVVGLFDLPALLKEPVFSPNDVRTRLFLESPDLEQEHARQAELGASPGELFHDSDGLMWFSTADPDGNLLTFWQFKPLATESAAD